MCVGVEVLPDPDVPHRAANGRRKPKIHGERSYPGNIRLGIYKGYLRSWSSFDDQNPHKFL